MKTTVNESNVAKSLKNYVRTTFVSWCATNVLVQGIEEIYPVALWSEKNGSKKLAFNVLQKAIKYY